MVIDLKNKKQYYKTYPKKKSNGKVRWISYALEPLLSEQQKLKHKLNKIYLPPPCVYGFIKGRGVKEAIANHIGKNYVCTFDLKDFFLSIKKKYLIQNTWLTEEEVEIATLNGRLVQGTVIAPVISNIYMREFDAIMNIIADANNWSYGRYVDDICISADCEDPFYKAQDIIEKFLPKGLKINKEKSKRMYKSEQQIVLGIIINTKASVNSSIRKTLRAKVHQNCITSSDKGYISYINSVNPEQASKLIGGMI